MVKPVKNPQKSSKYDLSKPVSVWPQDAFFMFQSHIREINCKNGQKWSKFDFSKNACEIRFSMLKIAKNHQILTCQNWCPFGHRTFSSCFRAGLRFDMVKPVKSRQKSSNFDLSKPVSVCPQDVFFMFQRRIMI